VVEITLAFGRLIASLRIRNWAPVQWFWANNEVKAIRKLDPGLGGVGVSGYTE
jgi:hypothetical protein